MSVADQITETLGPFAAESADLGEFVEAIAAAIDPIYEVIGEEAQDFAWSMILDPDTCPTWALPWLAQFEGVELTEEMDTTARRAAIVARDGSARGRPATIIDRVRRTLTISKRVVVRERYDENAYVLQIRTLESETPDEALTLAAIVSQKPAGIVLDYDAVIDGTYAELEATYASYGDVPLPSTTYDDLILIL